MPRDVQTREQQRQPDQEAGVHVVTIPARPRVAMQKRKTAMIPQCGFDISARLDRLPAWLTVFKAPYRALQSFRELFESIPHHEK